MQYLKKFNNKILPYDLTNKFLYYKTKSIPKLKKIILSFSCKTTDIKQLISSVLALELITNQRGLLTTTKQPNILLKIRKGNPVGCKITLRKINMYSFLFRSTNEIFPKLKNFKGFNLVKQYKQNTFSFELNEILNFSELEEHYSLFNNLNKLKVTLVTFSCTRNELLFILKELQFPIRTNRQI